MSIGNYCVTHACSILIGKIYYLSPNILQQILRIAQKNKQNTKVFTCISAHNYKCICMISEQNTWNICDFRSQFEFATRRLIDNMIKYFLGRIYNGTGNGKRRQHCPKLKLFNGFYSLYWMSRIVANRAETVLQTAFLNKLNGLVNQLHVKKYAKV